MPPTENQDYAIINTVYLAGLIALNAAAQGKELKPYQGEEYLSLPLATFALAKLISKEKVATWIREPFVEEQEHRPVRPKGRRLRFAVGELLSCSRCTGAWSALGLTALRTLSPKTGRLTAQVLALSALNDFLQASFSYLAGQTNQAKAQAEILGTKKPRS